MVHHFALSVVFFLIVTVLGSQFWNDVDKLSNELSHPQDTLAETTLQAPQPSPSPNEVDEKRLKRNQHLNRKFFRKKISVSVAEIETFKQTIVIDKSYPQNISLADMENKLLALGRLHEWFDIDTYDVAIYPKYWAKVCLSLWGNPLVDTHRYYCKLSPSYGVHKMRILRIREYNLHLDLLYCNCFNYESNCRSPISAAETVLVHKSGDNEFYIFENINATKNNRGYLNIKHFHGGITLPNPIDEDRVGNKNTKTLEKFVTLGADDIALFKRPLTIAKSYPENITMAELEYKLLQFGEIHHWPDLCMYNLNEYYTHWANLCVSLWGKQLNRTHRQACVISTSYAANKIRKLFLKERTLHFDLLFCKCYSYKSDIRYPASDTDAFLIHESSANEFFLFEQHQTGYRSYTLFIKDYKRVINLPELKEIN